MTVSQNQSPSPGRSSGSGGPFRALLQKCRPMALGRLCRRAARGIIEDARFYRRSATGWDRVQTASVFVTGRSLRQMVLSRSQYLVS